MLMGGVKKEAHSWLGGKWGKGKKKNRIIAVQGVGRTSKKVG